MSREDVNVGFVTTILAMIAECRNFGSKTVTF